MLIKANTSVVTLVGKTWSLHVREVIRTTPEENLAMIGDSVRFFKEHGKEVVYDAEHFFDGYKDDPRWPQWRRLKAAQVISASVDIVVLCDIATAARCPAKLVASLPKSANR